MKQKYFLNAFIFIFLAFLLIKFFKLTLTFPLIFAGIAILFVRRGFNKIIPRFLSIVFENIGIFFLLLGSIFSLFNSIELIKKKSEFPEISQSGTYQTTGNFKKNNSEILGYRYKDNIRRLTSRKIRKYKSKQTIIYDVIYNIDERNNRFTPHLNKPVNKEKAILFLGGSYTFGEGLNDNETLSFFLQNFTGLASINAGLHGYGAHQALQILDNEKLFNKKTSSYSVKTIIYRAIPAHIARTAGKSSWDIYGPCYQLDSKNNIVFKGSFIDCKVKTTNVLKQIISKIANTSEPFTSMIFSKIKSSFSNPSTNSDTEYKIFIEVIKKMNLIAVKKNINFIVLFEDFDLNNEVCETKKGISKKIINDLQFNNIEIIPTSKIFTHKTCINYPLSIEFDGHPSKEANLLIADYLSQIINIKNYSQ
tara:strand:+ start:465 stop:1727 length:1263 start_codon:yes stop_codon:yes gene_type:complete